MDISAPHVTAILHMETVPPIPIGRIMEQELAHHDMSKQIEIELEDVETGEKYVKEVYVLL